MYIKNKILLLRGVDIFPTTEDVICTRPYGEYSSYYKRYKGYGVAVEHLWEPGDVHFKERSEEEGPEDCFDKYRGHTDYLEYRFELSEHISRYNHVTRCACNKTCCGYRKLTEYDDDSENEERKTERLVKSVYDK